jgi:hypothetical protein
MRSIYSGDPGVDRQNLIFISSCHTTKIHTVSCPNFFLTRSFRYFVDPCNCVDPEGPVVSYLLNFIRFLSLMQKEREERFSQRHPLQSRCKRVPNEPIPKYGHSWPQRQGVCLIQETNRARRNGETAKRRLEGDMQRDASY